MQGLHFLDEIERVGHPWHGLWRGSNPTKIESPYGPMLNRPGESPSGVNGGSYGTCYAVKIPGTPAVTDTAEDIAGGLSWLDYGIFSGVNNRFYGRAGGPIYLDDDNQPWRVFITLNTWTVVGRTGTIDGDIRIYRLTGDGAFVQTQPFTEVFDCGGDLGVAAGLMVDDVPASGKGFLLSAADWPAVDSHYRRCRGLWQVAISGVPPAAVITLTLLDDTANNGIFSVSYSESFKVATPMRDWLNEPTIPQVYGPWYWTYSTVATTPGGGGGNPPYVMQSRSGVVEYRELLGGRYSGSTPQVVRLLHTQTIGASGDVTGTAGALDWSSVQTWTETDVWAIQAGGSDILTVNGSAAFTINTQGVWPNPPTITSQSGSMSLDGNSWPISSGGSSAFFTHSAVEQIRYSNALYGLIYHQQANGDNPVVFAGAAGKVATDTARIVAASIAAGPRHATEHPVTGQIVRDTSPVCWV